MIKPEVSIFAVIVTYNGEKTISDCLNSILQSKIPLQAIAVDNVSTDNTMNILRDFKEVTTLRQEKNIGPGQGYNVGMRYALDHGADYVLLLNQDVVIHQDMVAKLLQVAMEHPDFGILSPLHLNKDGTEIDDRTIKYIIRETSSFLNDLLFERVKPFYEVWFMPGAAWLMSAECIKTVGGFDDLFFIYGEDDDYCQRSKNHGYKFGLVQNATMLHKHIIGIPSKISAWQGIVRKSRYHSTIIKASLKRSNKPFLLAVILWRINHLALKLELLVKGQFSGLLAQLIAGTNALISLPRIWRHKRKSIEKGAFLNSK